MMTRISWQNAPISDRLDVYFNYMETVTEEDQIDFELFNTHWHNYSFDYVNSLFKAE